MERQSRGVRELRRCGRREGRRTPAARPGRGAHRDGARTSVALDDDRLRRLHDVQAPSPSREVPGDRAGPGGRLGRSAEEAPLRAGENMKVPGARRIRVGIVGANPDRGWAAQAHIPALKSLADDFEITALSTSRGESANAASKLFGVPLAFDNHQDLVNSAAVAKKKGVLAVAGLQARSAPRVAYVRDLIKR